MDEKLNKLVAEAQAGDRKALELVVRAVQDRVHHLAMRMLVDPADASDATQEILVRLVTRLSTFHGDSAFFTWVYRVAANYLMTARRVRQRDPGLDFDAFRAGLETGLHSERKADAEDLVLLNELRISCTMAMLLCLDLKHRIAYVLGDVLEFDHAEAAGVLEISPAAFRQRLSRARRQVVAFTAETCGLANPKAACRCPRRLPAARSLGRVIPGRTAYALADAPDYTAVAAQAAKVEGDLQVLQLQTATPHFAAPRELSERIAEIVATGD